MPVRPAGIVMLSPARLQINPDLRFNLGRHRHLELDHDFQRLQCDGGTVFTANQSDLQVTYQFDLKQRLKLTLKYTRLKRDPVLYADRSIEKRPNSQPS